MKALLRRFAPGAGRGYSLGLALVLLGLVLVSSAYLLWLTTQAARNERLAARQKLIEAYRGHLAVAQERLAACWRQTAEELDAQAETTPAPALFGRLVQQDQADAAVCFDPAGRVLYPDAGPADKASEPAGLAPDIPLLDLESSAPAEAAAAYARLAEQATNTDLCARALQAEARCLLRAGKKRAAVELLTGPLAAERFAHATDTHGRLLAPDAELLALELLDDPADVSAREAVMQWLTKQLLDYDSFAMPAPQRRFLLRQLQPLSSDPRVQLMLSAEDLALQYVEVEKSGSSEPALRPTSLPSVWQFASQHGRVVTLHRTESLLAGRRAGTAAQSLPADVDLCLLPPGKDSDSFLPSMLAGPSLPGWRLTLALKDQRLFDSAAEQRVAAYVWTGVLVVAAVAVLASLALGLVRRQTALTQLRNDLVANVTHELKTPLSSMRLLVETLLNSPQLEERTTRDYLELIAKENVRLSRLIDNFLTFSRIERNKYTFDFRETPAGAIAESAAAAVRERFNTPGCRFEVRIAPGLPSVLADADALVMALVNLLDNAFKYSGEAKQITLSAGIENRTVQFAVKDNGIGLSSRDTKRIFNRFHRVNPHLSATGGCGLGLSIVRFVITAHGGTVQVESQPGQGSTFSLRIPAGNPPAPLETKS